MNPNYISVIFLFVSSITLFSCVKDDEADLPVDNGYNYYPAQIGSYIIYKVDSVYHDQPEADIPGIHDSSQFYLKQYIESSFTDNSGRPSLRIENYKKSHADSTFILTDVWLATKTANALEVVEENRRFIKLGFPVNQNQQWDGNALNNLPERIFTYRDISSAYALNGINFEKTVRISQMDNSNVVEDEYAFEIYANDRGLIERYYKDLDTRINYQSNPVAENIRQGVEYHWQILEYGNE